MKRVNAKFVIMPIILVAIVSCNKKDPTPTPEVISNPYAYVENTDLKKTISNMKNLNNKELFYMEYFGDYKLNKLIDEDAGGNLLSTFKFVNKELLNGKTPSPFDNVNSDFGCSAFLAKDSNNHYLYGRNFDYKMDIAPIIVKTTPSNGYKSLSVVNTGFIKLDKTKISDGTTDISGLVMAPYMPMDGMNEKGLAMSILVVPGPMVYQTDETKKSLISSLMVRYILDNCKDIDEAKTAIDKFNMTYPFPHVNSNYHYFISDASGKSVVLEYIKENDESKYSNKVSYVNSNCVTNYYLTESMKEAGTGQDRYAILKNTLSFKENILSKEEATNLLSLVGKKNNPLEKSTTLWSSVYDLIDKTLTLYNRFDYSKAFEFSIN